MDIYLWTTDSLCCTPENNTTSQVNYTPVKITNVTLPWRLAHLSQLLSPHALRPCLQQEKPPQREGKGHSQRKPACSREDPAQPNRNNKQINNVKSTYTRIVSENGLGTAITPGNSQFWLKTNKQKKTRPFKIFSVWEMLMASKKAPSFFFSFFFLNIYLFGCTKSYLQHAEISIFVQACGNQLPDQGSNPGPLHWKRGLLTTRQPGKSPSLLLLRLKTKSLVLVVLTLIAIASSPPHTL